MRVIASILLTLALAGVARADALSQRVERLERRANVISQLLLKIQRLERTAQQQRGRIDSLEYRLKQQDRKMRDLYQDLDRRLSQRRSQPVPATPAQTTPSSETDGSGNPPSAVAGPAPTRPPDEAADAAYRKAFAFIRDRDYPGAVEGFEDFLRRYPDVSLAENAWYWLGEAEYAQQHNDAALRAFENVITRYPTGAKVPGALFKAGLIHAAKGDKARARALLQRLVDEFPSSAVTPLARAKLADLKP